MHRPENTEINAQLIRGHYTSSSIRRLLLIPVLQNCVCVYINVKKLNPAFIHCNQLQSINYPMIGELSMEISILF
jgi:hypothetical protein